MKVGISHQKEYVILSQTLRGNILKIRINILINGLQEGVKWFSVFFRSVLFSSLFLQMQQPNWKKRTIFTTDKVRFKFVV